MFNLDVSENYVTKVCTLMPIFAVVLGGCLSGCSMEASISSLNEINPEVFLQDKAAEVTPASVQNAFTQRGYIVQASVSYQDAPAKATTSRGFNVQTSVQGTLFKDQE